MNDFAPNDFERVLRRALAPVEPPERLIGQLETTLADLTEIAAEELEGWELSAMRDPRNWVRPVAAATIGATAGTALVLLRVRRNHRRRAASAGGPMELTEQTLKAIAAESRRVLGT